MRVYLLAKCRLCAREPEPSVIDPLKRFRYEVGGAGLAGGLPGLGSGMIRGPYAGWQLGQALGLTAMCTSGPLVLLDAGPGPGR